MGEVHQRRFSRHPLLVNWLTHNCGTTGTLVGLSMGRSTIRRCAPGSKVDSFHQALMWLRPITGRCLLRCGRFKGCGEVRRSEAVSSPSTKCCRRFTVSYSAVQAEAFILAGDAVTNSGAGDCASTPEFQPSASFDGCLCVKYASRSCIRIREQPHVPLAATSNQRPPAHLHYVMNGILLQANG